MTLMCEECFEQRNIKKRNGLFCKICGGCLVEVDENFIEPIIMLNKKGYYTKFCCSGHPNGNIYAGAYISFEDGSILPYLPIGYMYDKDIFTNIDFSEHNNNGLTIRCEFGNKDNLIELQKEILLSAINILDWAKSLPDISEEYE